MNSQRCRAPAKTLIRPSPKRQEAAETQTESRSTGQNVMSKRASGFEKEIL